MTGLIHILTGNGKGKTTSATGMAVRAFGNGLKVTFVQFLNGPPTGEVKTLEKLENVEIIRCNRATSFDYDNIPLLRETHNEMLLSAIETNPDILILDEVIGAVNYGYLDKDILLDYLKNHNNTEVVMTGRNAPDYLIDLADYVSEINPVKHPYKRGIKARKGIEY
ncbi:MAG: cob(I)yrinic acid a,c-diamide adenosyltransferase [Muribaculaceae bacterium]